MFTRRQGADMISWSIEIRIEVRLIGKGCAACGIPLNPGAGLRYCENCRVENE